MLDRIHFILVNTTHPGNIGATARAMKTMGLSQLTLVDPQRFPHQDATFRAAGADDLLQKAVITQTLDEALSDSAWVVGASVRQRKLSRPILTPRQLAEKILNHAEGKVAIVFGRESSGLTNEELTRCHDQVFIPTNPEFSSLNVASAAQVIAYEMRMAFSGNIPEKTYDEPLATADEMRGFYTHLFEALDHIHFLDNRHSKQLKQRIQLLFNRAELKKTEINILRGIFKTVMRS
ncbi:MAG: hypothetical protein A3E84_04510 [Gammaproteobacteria bacterium RIFCSPHIGHO2_12_FULL_42_13]|nr:MAG: hypothetical protein A3E84_04510 [Gammaproteobacteria bacterium RIFCSPHIGHO2_12_FULL_42_13]